MTMTKIEDRAYQDEGIENIRIKFREGFKSVCFVLPTGGGKTVVASKIMRGAVERGSRLLFTAHLRQLIPQCYEKLLAMGIPEDKIGVIMGDGKIRLSSGRVVKATRKDAPIQIASISTLRHRHAPPADIVFIDECHRALAKSYLELKQKYPNAQHIGLTATPYRNGGKGLGLFYASLVVGALPSFLIKHGFILAPRVWTVPPEELPDLKGVKTRNGDYDERQLAEACNTRQLVGSIVEHWKTHAAGRRTICFPVSIEHSKRIVQDFLDAGVKAEHLDSGMSDADRNAILGRLASGETLIVSSVGCLCEGFDLPAVKCAILARPTKSTGLFLQMSGRILRPWNDTEAIILDHAGSVLEHGMPSEDREFSLDDSKPKRKGMSTKTCLGCFAVVESIHAVCPACGKPFPKQERDAGDRSVVQVPGQLVQYGAGEQETERKTYWESLCVIASKNNYKDGWPAWKFKEKFGFWPPKSYKRSMGRQMTDGERDVMRAKLMRIARERSLPVAWVESKMQKQTQLSEIINERDGEAVVKPAAPQLLPAEQVSLPIATGVTPPPANDVARVVGLPAVPVGETIRWDV